MREMRRLSCPTASVRSLALASATSPTLSLSCSMRVRNCLPDCRRSVVSDDSDSCPHAQHHSAGQVSMMGHNSITLVCQLMQWMFLIKFNYYRLDSAKPNTVSRGD
jgi:hypothetical protein